MKTSMWLGATACALALVVACGEDEALETSASGGSGATGGSSGGTGGASGGSGGATGGTAGASGGSAGTGGTAGAAGSAGTGGATSAGRLLVAGTDFFTSTEVATVDLDAASVSGSVTVADGDAVPAAAGGLGFVLERTLAKVDLLSTDGSIDKSIDVGKAALGETGTASSNPVAIAAVAAGAAGGTATKAYVLFGAANHVAVVDIASASVTNTIDLGGYLDAGDGDGAVDMASAVYDASSDRVYFTLGRIDQTTVTAPSYELACPPVKALVLAIDAQSDALVDLNGSASGEGIELSLANPVDAAFDSTSGSLYVLSAGCFASAGVRSMHGVEKVALASSGVSTVYPPTSQDYLARLLLPSPNEALLDTFDATYAEHWYTWDPNSPALGPELSGVPAAPSVDDDSHLYGVDFAATVSVVRYGPPATATVVSSPWTGSWTSAAGTALVR
jgi:hypothetical protein